MCGSGGTVCPRPSPCACNTDPRRGCGRILCIRKHGKTRGRGLVNDVGVPMAGGSGSKRCDRGRRRAGRLRGRCQGAQSELKTSGRERGLRAMRRARWSRGDCGNSTYSARRTVSRGARTRIRCHATAAALPPRTVGDHRGAVDPPSQRAPKWCGQVLHIPPVGERCLDGSPGPFRCRVERPCCFEIGEGRGHPRASYCRASRRACPQSLVGHGPDSRRYLRLCAQARNYVFACRRHASIRDLCAPVSREGKRGRIRTCANTRVAYMCSRRSYTRVLCRIPKYSPVLRRFRSVAREVHR
jgi:hypothetical protein